MSTRFWPLPIAALLAGTGYCGLTSAQQTRPEVSLDGSSASTLRATVAAQSTAPDAGRSTSPGQAEVAFRAGAVEVDTELHELRLSGDVEVVVDRYRLTADRLELKRVQYGLEVQGDGSVAFCRCNSAPVTFGFSSVIVAPPTDLLLTDPIVRVAGVPVCWAPYLWLRSPRRRGLLAPAVAWRGRDGLLVGSGIHWPLALDEQGSPAAELDLRAAGYIEGGLELRGALSTRATSTRWRWDWLNQALFDAQSHGSVPIDGNVGGAWRVDVLRGPRALEGAGELAMVAKPYDRVRATLGVAEDGGALGWGLRAVGVRGAAWNVFEAVGPWFGAAAGREIGRGHAVDGALGGWVTRGRFGDESMWWASAGVGGVVNGGAVRAEWQSGGRGVLRVSEGASGFAGDAGVLGRASVPLVRNFGTFESPLWHWVEPFALGVTDEVGGHEARTLFGPNSAQSSRFAGAGIRNALESQRSHEALELRTVAGGMWQGTAEARPLVVGRMLAQSDFVAASTEAAWGYLEASMDDVSLRNSVRLGLRDGMHVAGWADGSRGAELLDTRWLTEKPWEGASGAWFSSGGWSAGSNLIIPWTEWLVSSVGAAADLTSRKLLGANADIAYRHPCGCLAVLAEAQRRLGRPGYDAAVAVDLMP